MTIAQIVVLEQGLELSFSFEDMLKYHGGGSPGGVAHAFKVLERALPLLDDSGAVERRAIHIATAFGGPGARDGLELVTRAVTDQRFTVTPAEGRHGRPRDVGRGPGCLRRCAPSMTMPRRTAA
jgi:hypothetical protein